MANKCRCGKWHGT